jgi:hypothetical protein
MSTDPLSQTSFSEASPQPIVGPQVPPPVKKSNLLPIALIIAVVTVIILSVLFWLLRASAVTQVTATPTPLPSLVPVETDQIRKDIEPDLAAIEAANPETDEHPFPPIDFTIRIKDPSVR